MSASVNSTNSVAAAARRPSAIAHTLPAQPAGGGLPLTTRSGTPAGADRAAAVRRDPALVESVPLASVDSVPLARMESVPLAPVDSITLAPVGSVPLAPVGGAAPAPVEPAALAPVDRAAATAAVPSVLASSTSTTERAPG